MIEVIPAYDPWKELNKSLFTDEALRINVDTRDFHCTINLTEPMEIKDLKTLIKYKKAFFFTIEQIFETLERLYIQSGGKASWRMLTFQENSNWVKYIRIFKTDHGYLMGVDFSDTHRFFKRSFWENATINTEALSTH